MTYGGTNRAASVALSITDAYTCVSRALVSTTTEKFSPSVIIGNIDWIDECHSVDGGSVTCVTATLRPGTRCSASVNDAAVSPRLAMPMFVRKASLNESPCSTRIGKY